MRQAMAQREATRESVAVDPDHLILTNGSMQAVTLTAEVLMDYPGDSVILEEFSYPGTLSAYRSLKYNMVGIKLDGYYAEILQVKDNVLRTVKMWEADRQEALPFADPE